MSALVLSDDMPSCVFGLEARNAAAHKIIAQYATEHAGMDVAIGLAGLLPIPGAATIALVGAIAAQAPVIYEPMARKLAAIYNSSPDGQTRKMVTETAEMGALADVGIEFLKEIATEFIAEIAAGTILTAIPFIGGIAAALMDAAVAATLTWRVGTMVAAYYQNGGAWIEDRKHTYDLAKGAVEGFSHRTEDRADLNEFARKNKTISEKHLSFATTIVEMMRGASLCRSQIRSALEAKQVPGWVIDQALNRAFAV